MVTIAIFVVLGIVLGILWSQFGDLGERFFFALMIGIVGAMVGFLVAMAICPAGTPHWTVQPVTKLLAMRSTDSTSGSIAGSFLFVTGDLNTEVKYIYYVETSDGGFQSKSIVAENNENVTVYQNSPEGGSLTVSTCKLVVDQPWAKYLAVQVDTKCGAKYAFNIPAGSLVSDYTIR